MDSKNYNSSISQKSNKPINNNLALIDLLCLSFQLCFYLFLFRIAYFLSNNNNNAKKHEIDSRLYKKLKNLKEDFFTLILKFLQAIHFSENNSKNSASNNKSDKICNKFLLTTGSKLDFSSLRNDNDSAFSSYSGLKILITILDCYNRILYLPNLSQITHPDSFSTYFYVGLVENMHGILSSLKLLKFTTSDQVILFSAKILSKNGNKIFSQIN